MDNATRLQYLNAMGIDVWVPRHGFVADLPAGGELSKNVEWSDDCTDAECMSSKTEGAIHGVIAEQTEDATLQGRDASQPDSGELFNNQRQVLNQSATPFTSPEHSSEPAWHNLQQDVSLCRACQLCETRTQTVFGVGSHRASWMLIGEAPGQNEDLQGEPFVGKAGQLLNEMLRAIGLTRDEVFIANILKCRPPNNSDPQAEEVAACHGFLQQQISLLQPKIILAVGRIAAQNLLNTQQPLAKLCGSQHRLENIPLVVVHHPAYLLRTLTEKAKAWDDLQFALSVYQSLEN